VNKPVRLAEPASYVAGHFQRVVMQEDYPQTQPQPKPWGFWTTIGFTLAIAFTFLQVQTVVFVAFIVPTILRDRKADIAQLAESLKTDGFAIALATCVSAPVVIGLILLFAGLRKGVTLRQYLALRKVSFRQLALWCLLLGAFIAMHDGLTYLVGRPVVPQVMIDVYATCRFAPLLWLAFIIAAPLYEELLFRGFLFKGFEHSILGPAGAVVITSLLWAITHTQYDFGSIAGIFLGGLLMGLARLRTSSIYPAIAMHVLQNIVATAQVAIYLQLSPGA